MFRYKFLRNIFFASVFIALALPALSYYIYYPSVIELFIQEKEKEAGRVANHLSSMLKPGNGDIKHASQFVASVQKMAPHLGHEFNLLKIKLYSKSGEILFSSDAGEIGEINSSPYFHFKFLLITD